MSLTEQTPRVQVTISTATDGVSFPYKFLESNDLVVVSSGRGVLVEDTDYTVIGAGLEGGGTVTMIGAVAAEVVTIVRATDISQELDLTYNGAFFSQSVEDALDKLTSTLQDFKEISGRCLKLPQGEIDGYVSILSAATARASKLLGFDENGAIALLTNGDQDLSGYQLQPSEGAFVDGDKTKLDGIEALTDVTDEANVVAALNGATVASTTLDKTSIIEAYTEKHAASHTISAAECYGGVHYVTSAATITLPAVADGMSVSIVTIGAIAVSVDPNASDLIYLDGTALDDGDKITNTSTAGDVAVLTYYDATGWYATTNSWTDGGV